MRIGLPHLGFDQRTAQDSAPLLMQADRIVEHFRSDDLAQAEYVFEGDDFDPKKYADRIEASAVELRESLDDVAESARYVEKTVQDKQVLTKEYDGVHLHGAQVFESYCRLLGEDKLADRVRTSVPRSAPGETEPEVGALEPPSAAVVDQGIAEP